MIEITLVPELNFWMRRIIHDSPVYDTHHKIPSTVSEFWREKRSVLELLFNETFDDIPMQPSSSSGSPYDIETENDRRYIHKYRRVNLLLIPDKNVIYRTQVYRWSCNIFASNSNKYLDYFDMTGSHDPEAEVFNASLPYDVPEKDRSPYITWDTTNYLSTNYPLIKPSEKPFYPPNNQGGAITTNENLFDLTDQDLDMLDMLYDFKTGILIDLSSIDYTMLTSCIAKLVYIYLSAMINDDYSNYQGTVPISLDDKNIICRLYEKHVINILYLLKSKQYGIIFKMNDNINEQPVPIYQDHLMIQKKQTQHVIITDEMYDVGEYIIQKDIPWNRKDFFVYKDGIMLTQDVEFTLALDFTDPDAVVARLVFLQDIFLPGERLFLVWSYADPYSTYVQEDGANHRS